MLAEQIRENLKYCGEPGEDPVPLGHRGDASQLVGVLPPHAFGDDGSGLVLTLVGEESCLEIEWALPLDLYDPGQRIVTARTLGGREFRLSLVGSRPPESRLWPAYHPDRPPGPGAFGVWGTISLDRPEDVAFLADVFRWYRGNPADA